MSSTMLRWSTQLALRFYDRSVEDGYLRQARLINCLVAVAIFHAIMCIYFVHMQGVELEHKRVFHDTDIAFELYVAPPPPVHHSQFEPLDSLELTEGYVQKRGAASGGHTGLREELRKSLQEERRVVVNDDQKVVSGVNRQESPVQVNKVELNPIRRRITSASSESMPSQTNFGQAEEKTKIGAEADNSDAGIGTKVGDGPGEGLIGDGDDTGIADLDEGSRIALARTELSRRAQGNIGPYHRDMLLKIAANWQGNRRKVPVVILLTILKDGTLLEAKVLESGGKKADRAALKAVETTEFAPLPDWLQGEQLTFRVEMSSL